MTQFALLGYNRSACLLTLFFVSSFSRTSSEAKAFQVILERLRLLAVALALLYLAKIRLIAHLDSHSSHDLMIRTDRFVLFSFGKGSCFVFANCSLFGAKATLSYSAGLVCSSASAEACAILQAFRFYRQHQQVCRFYFLMRFRFRHSLFLTLCGTSSRGCLVPPSRLFLFGYNRFLVICFF